ncbi:MAG: ATP-binding cassette domain-containing protein [Planctomycetes bacterium]|nr:ATP-binding cassette domain-containing protein [Planctomycetota bacterium]MCP4838987.1 ATP-binding cassette domain-containing protein [Planctomycetota bacterium]
MAEVRMTGVTKAFPGGVTAVASCDLTIPNGQFTVLVGPSGCGKSTTLRMIAGLEAVSSGTIHIGDRVVNDVPPRNRNVAMVFQNYALYPHMSVEKNLRFPLERRRATSWLKALMSDNERSRRRDETAVIGERVAEVAAQLEIDTYLRRFPRELSGGQRQRVALGRALVRDPEVFLLDEPLSNLDAQLRLAMRTELRQLHRRLGATMIYVTHDQEEAMALGDVLVVMKDGVIHQVGAPREIYEQPADRFVASFVGTPPMNLVKGEVRGGNFHTTTGASLPAPAGASGGLAVLGIRPESIRVDGAGELAATVTSIERLGDRMDVVLDIGGVNITARSEPSDIEEGDQCKVSVEESGIHLFDVHGKRTSG